jgi:hypothetical protein
MSDDKVKVSMFLTAPIAQAVKIRAAREGTGVSEVVANMFQCAHCREAITDDFIIGKPTLIAPNRYAVFFHKNKKECAAARGGQVRFFLQCPKCKALPQQSFDPIELRRLVQAKAVEFYCISCDHTWKSSAKEAKEIAALLA